MENTAGASLLLPTSELAKALTGSAATFGLHQCQRGAASKMNLAWVPKISLFSLYFQAFCTCRIILPLKGSCPRVPNQAFCTGREVTSGSLCYSRVIFSQTFTRVINLLQSSPV